MHVCLYAHTHTHTHTRTHAHAHTYIYTKRERGSERERQSVREVSALYWCNLYLRFTGSTYAGVC